MKNLKFTISNFNKYLIFCIGILFIYLFYLSIPTIYNKDTLQKELSKKIFSNYNLNLSLSSDIDYLILPSPHFLIRNAKVFKDRDAISEELGQIKKWQKRRIEIYNRYTDGLRSIDKITLPKYVPGNSLHLFVIAMNLDKWQITRDELIEKLKDKGIGVAVHYKPIHQLTYFNEMVLLIIQRK